MSHQYEIVNVDTCEVLECFNDLGLAQDETDALNARGKNYVLCYADAFLVPDWPGMK